VFRSWFGISAASTVITTMTIVSACVFGFPDALGSVAIAMNDVVITMTAAVMSAATGIIARNISFVPQLETLKYQLGRVFAEDPWFAEAPQSRECSIHRGGRTC